MGHSGKLLSKGMRGGIWIKDWLEATKDDPDGMTSFTYVQDDKHFDRSR